MGSNKLEKEEKSLVRFVAGFFWFFFRQINPFKTNFIYFSLPSCEVMCQLTESVVKSFLLKSIGHNLYFWSGTLFYFSPVEIKLLLDSLSIFAQWKTFHLSLVTFPGWIGSVFFFFYYPAPFYLEQAKWFTVQFLCKNPWSVRLGWVSCISHPIVPANCKVAIFLFSSFPFILVRPFAWKRERERERERRKRWTLSRY